MKKLIFTIWILAVTINVSKSEGEWIPIGPENNKWITSFTSNEHFVFTGTYYGEMYKTSNQGISWIEIDSIRPNGNNVGNHMISIDNFIICAGQFGGIYRSSNNGDNWNFIINGMPGYYSVGSLYSTATHIFTSYATGIFRSSNYGDNWYSVNNGLITYGANAFISTEDYLFASTEFGVFRSSNNGDYWIKRNSGLSGNITSFSYNGIYLFASGKNGVFRSSDYGENWIASNNGFSGLNATSIASSGNKIFVSNNLGLHYSYNNGLSWNLENEGFNSNTQITKLHINNNQLYTGIREGSVWKRALSDFTQEISSNDIGVSNFPVPELSMINYLDCESDLVIYPKAEIVNFGTSNQFSNFEIKMEIKNNGTIFYSDIIYDTLSSGLTRIVDFDPIFFSRSTTEKNYIIKSWTILNTDNNTSNDTASSLFSVTNINFGGGHESNFGYYFANSTPEASCAPNQPVFYWEDTTGSVNLISNGVAKIPLSGGNLNDGYFLLNNILPQGDKFQFNGICYDTFGISTNGIIGLGSSTGGLSEHPPPIDFGNSEITGAAILAFWYDFDFSASMITGRNLKYKVANNKIIITYDRVPQWYPSDANDYTTFQVILETSPLCGLNNGIVTVQYDNTKCGSTFLNNYNNYTLRSHKVGIQNITGNKFINYRFKTNEGMITSGPLFYSPTALSFNSDNTLLPIELSSFSSFINENNVNLIWQTINEINNSGFDIERSATDDQWIKAGSIPGNGNSNEPKEYSFTDKNLSPGKYKYRLKQIDFNGSFEYYSLAGEVFIGIPDKYELSQNYPNPFNPSTVIRYSLTENSFTTLKIYDVTGREMTILVNEKQEAGRYEVIFNGSNFASGVYFYELRSGDFVAQKKMMILK